MSDFTVVKDKTMQDLRNMVEIQGSNGNWNYDPYMLGLFNGMELMLATLEGRDPAYRTAPEQWLRDRPAVAGEQPTEVANG